MENPQFCRWKCTKCLNTGGGVPDVLHQVSVPVMTNDDCQTMFKKSGHRKTIRKHTLLYLFSSVCLIFYLFTNLGVKNADKKMPEKLLGNFFGLWKCDYFLVGANIKCSDMITLHCCITILYSSILCVQNVKDINGSLDLNYACQV